MHGMDFTTSEQRKQTDWTEATYAEHTRACSTALFNSILNYGIIRMFYDVFASDEIIFVTLLLLQFSKTKGVPVVKIKQKLFDRFYEKKTVTLLTFGSRAFRFSLQEFGIHLPVSIQEGQLIPTFQTSFKTFYFQLAYPFSAAHLA